MWQIELGPRPSEEWSASYIRVLRISGVAKFALLIGSVVVEYKPKEQNVRKTLLRTVRCNFAMRA